MGVMIAECGARIGKTGLEPAIFAAARRRQIGRNDSFFHPADAIR
jgi:hypothetical protein